MIADTIESKKTKALDAIAHLKNPALGLTAWDEPLPKEPHALQRYFSALKEVWTAGQPDYSVADVVRDMAHRLDGCVSEHHRDRIRTEAGRMFSTIENRIADCLRAGVTDRDFLLTSSFREVVTIGGGFAAGNISSLPEKHFARTLLAPDDLYRIDNTAYLILGPTFQSRPRQWYSTALAISLTQKNRKPQKWEEDQKARLAKHQEEQERIKRESSPEGRLLKRLEKLEAKVS